MFFIGLHRVRTGSGGFNHSHVGPNKHRRLCDRLFTYFHRFHVVPWVRTCCCGFHTFLGLCMGCISYLGCNSFYVRPGVLYVLHGCLQVFLVHLGR